MQFLFGKSAGGGTSEAPKPKKDDALELGKQWKRNLQKEARKIDRDIANIRRMEQRSITECKKLAKAGRMSAVKILAKEIANTRKSVERMHMAKAQLNSVSSNLQTTMSMIKMQGCIAKSAEIMGAMNKLVNVREISETMTAMAREMERTGLVDEIIGDAMDSMDSEGIDAAADAEVDRIVAELTSDVLAPAGATPNNKVSSTTVPTNNVVIQEEAPPEATASVEEDASTQDLLSRLQAL